MATRAQKSQTKEAKEKRAKERTKKNIFRLMKSLDPGSVVRESEFRMSRDPGSVVRESEKKRLK